MLNDALPDDPEMLKAMLLAEVLRSIGPRQQLIDIAVEMTVDDPGEDVCERPERVDVIQFDEVDGSRFRRHSLEAVAAIAVKEMPSMNERARFGKARFLGSWGGCKRPPRSPEEASP